MARKFRSFYVCNHICLLIQVTFEKKIRQKIRTSFVDTLSTISVNSRRSPARNRVQNTATGLGRSPRQWSSGQRQQNAAKVRRCVCCALTSWRVHVLAGVGTRANGSSTRNGIAAHERNFRSRTEFPLLRGNTINVVLSTINSRRNLLLITQFSIFPRKTVFVFNFARFSHTT